MTLISRSLAYILTLGIVLCSSQALQASEASDEDLHESQVAKNLKNTLNFQSTELSNFKQQFNESNTHLARVAKKFVDLDVDKRRDDFRKSQSQAKDKIIKSMAILNEMAKSEEPSFLETIQYKNSNAINNWLSQKGFKVQSYMDEKDINSVIHKASSTSPNIEVSYSGNTPYSGSKSYSDYNYCKARVCDTPCPTFGDCSKRDCSTKVSCSGNVGYEGTTSYSGKKTISCSKDHHDCKCDLWGEFVVNGRTLADGYQFLMEEFKQNKSQIKNIYEDIKDSVSFLEKAEDESHQSLSMLQQTKDSVIYGAEKMDLVFGAYSVIEKNKENYNKKILGTVVKSEEEQREEKKKLQASLENKEIQFEKNVAKKDDIIIENHKKIENLLIHQSKVQEEKYQINDKFKEDKREIEKNILIKTKENEKDFSLLDSKVRSVLPRMFRKIAKGLLQEEERDQYLQYFQNEDVKLTDIFKKMETFMNKYFD